MDVFRDPRKVRQGHISEPRLVMVLRERFPELDPLLFAILWSHGVYGENLNQGGASGDSQCAIPAEGSPEIRTETFDVGGYIRGCVALEKNRKEHSHWISCEFLELVTHTMTRWRWMQAESSPSDRPSYRCQHILAKPMWCPAPAVGTLS